MLSQNKVGMNRKYQAVTLDLLKKGKPYSVLKYWLEITITLKWTMKQDKLKIVKYLAEIKRLKIVSEPLLIINQEGLNFKEINLLKKP